MGFAPAGVAVGFVPVDAGVVAGVVMAGVPLPLPLPCGVPEFPTGEPVAGVVVGSDVRGVGSGGNGFVKMLATIWSIPSVLSLLRYLYQVVRLSFQPVFAVANLVSVPASATARA